MKKTIRCSVCEGDVSKTAKGLCIKLLRQNKRGYFCMGCLSNFLEVSEEELLEKAEDFRREGCKLFL